MEDFAVTAGWIEARSATDNDCNQLKRILYALDRRQSHFLTFVHEFILAKLSALQVRVTESEEGILDQMIEEVVSRADAIDDIAVGLAEIWSDRSKRPDLDRVHWRICDAGRIYGEALILIETLPARFAEQRAAFKAA